MKDARHWIGHLQFNPSTASDLDVRGGFGDISAVAGVPAIADAPIVPGAPQDE